MQNHLHTSAIQIGLVLSLCLLSSLTQALGLSEPKLNSKLGEPLRMEIALINTGALGTEQLIVGPADYQQYEKFDISYQSIYHSLKYSVLKRDDKLLVEITSRQPVKEPYLDILLKLKWPDGELLKQVTVLLDTP